MTSNWNLTHTVDPGLPRRSFGMTLPQVAVAVALLLSAAVLVTRHVEPGSGDEFADLRQAADEAQAMALDALPSARTPADGDELRLAAATRVAVAGPNGALPRLRPDVAQAASSPGAMLRTDVHGETRLIGEIEGLVVVHPGAKLVLEDVVLRGSLVSAGALDDDDTGRAPRIAVVGSLRIDPSDALPGVAVLVPEGTFVADGADSSVQVRGDVICRAVRLAGSGSVQGRIATQTEPQLSPRIALLDDPRMTTRWSPVLQVADARSNVLAERRVAPTWDEVRSMTSYEFPADRGR